MSHEHPWRLLQREAGAEFFSFGPTADQASMAVEMVHTFGAYEAEYAAIRKGVGVFHEAQRGLVEVAGADRLAFLHNFVTHDTKSLAAGQGRRAFLLSKAGRIVADLVLLEQEQRLLIDLDIFQAPSLAKELEGYVFTEDVQVRDRSDEFVHLALHGPASVALLEKVTGVSVAGIQPLHHVTVSHDGADLTVYRRDDAGSLGLHVLAPTERAGALYELVAQALGGLAPEVEGGVRREIPGRGVGWLAYNTARIEAGTPIFHIDFGPDSLPHETGSDTLADAVSFNKGCYLGQEIVARMQSLGHPKKVLVGLRFADDRLPIAGSQVFEAGEDGATSTGQVIGGVTSSAISPLLGNVAVAFAVLKWGRHRADTRVSVPAEGQLVGATVQGLRFIKS